MAKVDKQILIKFGPQEPSYLITQAWPKDSRFLKLVLGPEGIYTYFEVPEIMVLEEDGVNLQSENWNFVVVKPGTSVQEEDEFLDIITAYSEVPPAQLKEQGLPSDYQAVVVFTFYLRNRPSSLKIV
jgi:hypothetical protein